jgi:putative FmdB family regulatory protein
MPNYDYQCEECGHISERFFHLIAFDDHKILDCPLCGIECRHDLVITKAPATEDWGNGGSGRWFEHLGPQGMSFASKSSYNNYLKENGIREWVPKPGMPSDGRG